MIEFPAYLVPLLDNYSITFDDNRYQTEFDDGLKKSRLLSCATYKVITMTYHACKDHLIDFETWYKNTIKFGQKKFCWVDPCTGKQEIAKIRDIPNYAPDNQCIDSWNISISLEVKCATTV